MPDPDFSAPLATQNLDPYQELVWHLHRLPGGAAAAMPDFFAPLLEAAPTPERWQLREGGELQLDGEGILRQGQTILARAPQDLLAAARQGGVEPLILMLLALAVGHLEEERRLKSALPKLDAAAKDLMLMTVCRLCG